MCIRDRFIRVDNVAAALDEVTAAGGAVERAPWTMPMAGTCLLYTSDAADERSRVDLGGRRIN